MRISRENKPGPKEGNRDERGNPVTQSGVQKTSKAESTGMKGHYNATNKQMPHEKGSYGTRYTENQTGATEMKPVSPNYTDRYKG
jgi:hypothetical protein